MTSRVAEHFTAAQGLTFAFARLRRSPWRAARLAAFDLAALSILAVLVWTSMKPGAAGSSWIAALIVAWPLWQLVSLSAWLRYLAGQERPGPVPHRLWKTEARLFGLYVVWALIGGFAMFLASLPAGVLWGAAGPQALSALWMMAVFAVGLWFFARFVPLPTKVVVEDTLDPFGFWEETEAIAGRLRWAAASVGAAHIGAMIAMILLALFLGEEPGAALAQADRTVFQTLEHVRETGLGAEVVALGLFGLMAGALCRLLLRGVAVCAALAPREPHPTDPAPLIRPSSSPSPDGPGRVPEAV